MSRTKTTAESYFHHLEARDWDAVAGVLAPDVRYDMPQTRELITGRDRFLRFNREYPGDWHLTVRRLLADGPHAVAWINARVADDHMDAVVFVDVVDDRITHITDYWPETYEPPPGREHLTERY